MSSTTVVGKMIPKAAGLEAAKLRRSRVWQPCLKADVGGPIVPG